MESRPDACINVCRTVFPDSQCSAEGVPFFFFEQWKYEVEVIRKVEVVEDCLERRQSRFGTVVRIDDKAVEEPFLHPAKLVGRQFYERLAWCRSKDWEEDLNRHPWSRLGLKEIEMKLLLLGGDARETHGLGCGLLSLL